MSYRMWKNGRSKDYKMLDRMIGEQYRIGGVDMWLYKYVGNIDPKNPEKITDITTIADNVLMENAHRKYDLEAVTLPVVYQIQDATPDFKIAGMFYFDTMDITVHYNTMLQYVGRKIVVGDVIELPNLRDLDAIGTSTGINRFFVVKDAFLSAEGYSATWLAHIYKIRVKPLTDSPEFSDLLHNDNNNLDGSQEENTNPNSNYDKELEIMRNIMFEADNEVPYIHYDNEHIYNDTNDVGFNHIDKISNGLDFPVNPSNGSFFIKHTIPMLYEYVNNKWELIDSSYDLTFPTNPNDTDFFYAAYDTELFSMSYTLYQYYQDEDKWKVCSVPIVESLPTTITDEFVTVYQNPKLYQYKNDKKEWEVVTTEGISAKLNSEYIRQNIFHPHDQREFIPPAINDVRNGEVFPFDPVDGEMFYRTDFEPPILWIYEGITKSWTKFDYGGRLRWQGGNHHKIGFVNEDDDVRTPMSNIVKPNMIYKRR